MTFVDSSAWFALFVPTDPHNAAADGWLTAHPGPLLTTDYVIDETLTLLRARGQRDMAVGFGIKAFSGTLATVHYLTTADITAAWDVFARFADKDWSFTDCTSKVVMEALGIPTTFTFDHHFRQFGTVVVVP